MLTEVRHGIRSKREMIRVTFKVLALGSKTIHLYNSAPCIFCSPLHCRHRDSNRAYQLTRRSKAAHRNHPRRATTWLIKQHSPHAPQIKSRKPTCQNQE